ncbi:MAG: S1 RNA-binding domain-containing protein, partial [Pirellulaceae bacterium]|nr:S1 RNA-binding domain-containing protein [Pirellulaceae bacterium]
ILSALTKPRRDPREDLPSPVFRRSIMKLVDLKPGMELQGTVLNVVDFGAFVDIGISDNALVHISRLVDRFVEDPHEVVGVGDVLRVWVLGIEKDRRRVSLTAIDPNAQPPAAQQATSETTPAAKKKGAPPPRPHIKQMVKSGGAKRTSRGKTSKPPSRPVTPLTEGMVAGTEPLRSFADLQQFLSASQPKNDVSDESAGD